VIEFRQLRFLATAIDHGSLHRAAVVLGVEQSTLSRSIAKLERVVGVPLLSRSRVGVAATPAGAEFIQSARPMVAMAERMLAETRLAGQSRGGRLTIGHVSSISSGHLRTSLEHFRQAFPDVEATPVEAPREVLLAGLDKGWTCNGLVPVT
jgi:DNA-binding transcriptional LysR family regulator